MNESVLLILLGLGTIPHCNAVDPIHCEPKLRSTIKVDKELICSVAFSPDGKLLATAGKYGAITLFNAESGKEILSFDDTDEQFPSIAFHPDGQTLATAGADNLIKLWDLKGKKKRSQKANQHGIRTWPLVPMENESLQEAATAA
jgi:WD40 repeat protein